MCTTKKGSMHPGVLSMPSDILSCSRFQVIPVAPSSISPQNIYLYIAKSFFTGNRESPMALHSFAVTVALCLFFLFFDMTSGFTLPLLSAGDFRRFAMLASRRALASHTNAQSRQRVVAMVQMKASGGSMAMPLAANLRATSPATALEEGHWVKIICGARCFDASFNYRHTRLQIYVHVWA